MGFLEKNDFGAALPLGMDPVFGQGFEKGQVYHQVDLGSLATAEDIARYYLEGNEDIGHFTIKALMYLNEANHSEPGKYVGFAGSDPDGSLISYVYERTS